MIIAICLDGLQKACELDMMDCAPLTTWPGDRNMMTLEQARPFAGDGSARIQR
jgi:hypothetical protein